MNDIPKVVRDDQVAVLISPGYGAGWSTWAHHTCEQHLLFDPDVVAWVEAGKTAPFPDLRAKYNDDYYTGGVENLVIKWLPVGTKFLVREYDGSESLLIESNVVWNVA